MAFKDLSHLDTELLLRFIEYRMTQEERGRLIHELPGIYNRWMNQNVAVVMRRTDMPPVSKDGCAALAGESADDFSRELTLAKDAIADKNPNEYAYRLIRANAALAQALIWTRQAADAPMETSLMKSMEELMSLADRTRIAFVG